MHCRRRRTETRTHTSTQSADTCCPPSPVRVSPMRLMHFAKVSPFRPSRRGASSRRPVKLHADQLSDLNGARLAADHGALSADHLEYTSTDGAAALARAGTVAVLLPGAYYTLRETQAPPVASFRGHGVRMALATDCNPGTSPLTSL